MHDGCKLMPKIKCPCCGKRIADLPNKEYKNAAIVKKYSAEMTEGDAIILECPHCHEFVSLQFDSLKRLIIPKESA